MNDRDSAYAEGPNAFQRMAALSDSYGIDAESANAATADCVAWLRECLQKAQAAKVEVRKTLTCPHCTESFTQELLDMEKLAKSVSAIAKTMDIVARLTAFTQGKEDSRPGGGGAQNVLQALTNEQLTQVMAWVAENQAAAL
jgi:hypothetical protein